MFVAQGLKSKGASGNRITIKQYFSVNGTAPIEFISSTSEGHQERNNDKEVFHGHDSLKLEIGNNLAFFGVNSVTPNGGINIWV